MRDHDPMDLMSHLDRAILWDRPQLAPATLQACGVPVELRSVALDADNFVARVTAAPGQRLTVAFTGTTAFLVAHQRAADASSDARESVDVQQAIAFKLCAAKSAPDLDEFLGDRARDALIALAQHETDEWLRVDGQRLRDPHPHHGRVQSSWVSPPPCAVDCWCRR